MINQIDKDAPVVVGGVGGSGTRVIAQILSELGYYIGNDLNVPQDNLLFTLLFKRPKWFYKNLNNPERISTGLSLFRKCMLHNAWPTVAEMWFLINALVTMSLYGHNKSGAGKGTWPITRIKKLFSSNIGSNNKYIGWGWKEPNSFLLIDNLTKEFSHTRYIHVIRNGLDMAFSSNQQQLNSWGPLYGVQMPISINDVPKASLKYWIKANMHVLETGRKLGRDHFHLLVYDELCISPEITVKKLIDFLGISVDEKIYQKIIQLPKKQNSIGRYEQHDLSQFDASDLDALSKICYLLNLFTKRTT